MIDPRESQLLAALAEVMNEVNGMDPALDAVDREHIARHVDDVKRLAIELGSPAELTGALEKWAGELRGRRDQ